MGFEQISTKIISSRFHHCSALLNGTEQSISLKCLFVLECGCELLPHDGFYCWWIPAENFELSRENLFKLRLKYFYSVVREFSTENFYKPRGKFALEIARESASNLRSEMKAPELSRPRSSALIQSTWAIALTAGTEAKVLNLILRRFGLLTHIEHSSSSSRCRVNWTLEKARAWDERT